MLRAHPSDGTAWTHMTSAARPAPKTSSEPIRAQLQHVDPRRPPCRLGRAELFTMEIPGGIQAAALTTPQVTESASCTNHAHRAGNARWGAIRPSTSQPPGRSARHRRGIAASEHGLGDKERGKPCIVVRVDVIEGGHTLVADGDPVGEARGADVAGGRIKRRAQMSIPKMTASGQTPAARTSSHRMDLAAMPAPCWPPHGLTGGLRR